MKRISVCLLIVTFCIGLLLGCNQNSAENGTTKTTGDVQSTSGTQMTQSTVPVPFDPYALAAQIPEEVQEKMKVDALSQFDPSYPYPEGWMPEVSFAVYGAFGDVYALFIDGFGVLDYISSEFVDGIEIAYPNSRHLYVYYDGCYYRLQEAMDAKIIDRSDLERIVENYYSAHPDRIPDLTPGEYSDTLSDELRAEIEAYYGGAREEDDEDSVAGWHYYGTYNGYAILMCIGQLDWVEEKDIGGRIFSWSSGFTLIGFKNNLEYELEELYAMDHITQADLDELLMKHDAFYLEYIESLKSGDPIFS